MNGIRMIATDLDGTLLRSDKSISAYTYDVLRRFREKGGLFVAATARPVRAVRQMLPDLPLDAGIYHNGAVVWNADSRIGGFGIENPAQIVRMIVSSRPQSRISVESEEVLYANYPADETWPGIEYIYTQDFAQMEGSIADKIIVEADTQEKVEEIGSLLPENCYAQLCENRLALCMHKEASKPRAIALVAQMYGVAMNEIACFGDDHNDIAMLRACGCGVAVANAINEVKRAADITLPHTNDEDGVARWIEQNLICSIMK